MALTVDQLALRVSILTSLSSAPGDEERTLIDQWVNEAMLRVFEDTQCVVTKVNVTLVGGEDEYAIDRGILTVLNYAQSASNPTVKISVIDAADILERRFLSSSGEVRYFSVLGGNVLIVSPTPTVNQELVFYVVPVPDEVSGSDDIFQTGLPTYAQRALECYLNALAFEQSRDFQAAAYWKGEYVKECGKVRITLRRQAGRTLPASRIGYPDRVTTPTRNDTYSSD